MTSRKHKSHRQGSKKAHLQKQRQLLDHLAHQDYGWIVPLADKINANADVIARYLSEVLANLATTSVDHPAFVSSRWLLTKNLALLLVPKADEILSQMEKSFQAFELALGHLSADLLRDPDITGELIPPLIELVASAVSKNPRMVVLFGHPNLVKETFGEFGDQVSALLNIIPALSRKASQTMPHMREVFFSALHQIPKADSDKLHALAEEILQQVYSEHVFPKLREILEVDPRGKVLAPILLGAVRAIPGSSCLNAVISIACTPHSQLTTGRIIAIAIQEMGGLYIKLSQVIAELCPPSLGRELRRNQNDAGGIFPSIEKSWEYVLAAVSQDELKDWRHLLCIPERPVPHFASASVGALYEIELTDEGKAKLGTESVLLKLQRPGLKQLFIRQSECLLHLCDEARDVLVHDDTLTFDSRSELLGIAASIRRAVLNYYRQSTTELDFTNEESNALRVQQALGQNHPVRIPKYYFSSPNAVLTERMSGTKVTRIVQTKYLERREIADSIASAYLDLLFEQGVVWADPHPGNILYDDVSNRVSMIDLNPCFVWDKSTREMFKHLLYRLLLRDADGVYRTLHGLVEDKSMLENNNIVDDLGRFLNTPFGPGSLVRFVGEFIKTLSENGIDLRIEVQAALRGLSQLTITANATSARNSFGALLRRHFGLREVVSAAWQIGIMRVLRVVTGLLFDLAREMPKEDVGPVLDERDIHGLSRRLQELRRAGVCDIRFLRISPEDHPNLRMSADGSYLLVTSDLRIAILEKRRPATVRYVIEIPTRTWLRERQEFVKLGSIARNFCIIECLEQLRRNSLDDYWRIVEAWNKHASRRTVEETRLVGEVKVAAQRLYALRFVHIWDEAFAGLPNSARRVWKFLINAESWREEAEQKYITSIRRKFGNVIFASLAFGTFYRIKMVWIEAIIWVLRMHVKSLRFAMHLLPMTSQRLEDLILFSLGRNFTSQPKGR